jgi:FkbM family methyltransferase
MHYQTNARVGSNDGEQSAPGTELPFRLRLLRQIGKQTWIPRGQDRLMRAIWDPDTSPSFPFEVEFFGMTYGGDLARFIDWSVFAYGSYAYAELSLLEALAAEIRTKRGHVFFFDVGANLGHHSLFMAGRSDAVIAFEPFPPLQQLIRQKSDRNGLKHLRIVPYALGEANENKAYYPGDEVNSGTGTFYREGAESEHDAVTLEVRTGDALCEALKLPQIDLLKVDVEGYEPMVFRGLAERIHKDRPPILTEFSPRSEAEYKSEAQFRKSFWEGAIFAEVFGRNGCAFELKPFMYGRTRELLILPPEMAYFAESRM